MITPEHVEELLASDDERAVLVVVAGAAAVVPGTALDTDDYRGALQVVTRRDLRAQLDTDTPSRRELEEVAARLDSTVTRLGA
ncbi:hypothetical protein [Streptomyces galbus]|uniref:Uncharacterized protein n=1 Tax=Streptomyces galbus TaxID=33898 RepID=A0ABX1IX65_STRGB|nr:hypothetical protein [Streptomyces galbus]NKQ28793.1 hypothetical protein [Streptomyces galbus]